MQYSDHCAFSLANVSQLNIAVLGVLKIFPHKGKLPSDPTTYVWSCVFRTSEYLTILHENKEMLNRLAIILSDIALNDNFDVNEKNKRIEQKSKEMIKDLIEIGFPIKNFKMITSKLFNPNMTDEELMQNPEKYVLAPSFLIEDTNSHKDRLNEAYKQMLKTDISTAQEVQFGNSNDINFSQIHDDIMANYPNYSFIIPITVKQIIDNNGYTHHPITYFNNTVFKDVTNEYILKIIELYNVFEIFGATKKEHRIQIIALEHLTTKDIYIIVNIHANYNDANKLEAYRVLNNILLNTTNLIVAGDFNLEKKNVNYIDEAVKKFNGKYKILITPEPETIGNPTFDAIFIS